MTKIAALQNKGGASQGSHCASMPTMIDGLGHDGKMKTTPSLLHSQQTKPKKTETIVTNIKCWLKKDHDAFTTNMMLTGALNKYNAIAAEEGIEEVASVEGLLNIVKKETEHNADTSLSSVSVLDPATAKAVETLTIPDDATTIAGHVDGLDVNDMVGIDPAGSTLERSDATYTAIQTQELDKLQWFLSNKQTCVCVCVYLRAYI